MLGAPLLTGARTSRATRPDLVNGAGDDTLEIWNLVFMQFERDASGNDDAAAEAVASTPGAGLERITAILQGVNNNFDTDLFAPDPRADRGALGAELPRRHGRRRTRPSA